MWGATTPARYNRADMESAPTGQKKMTGVFVGAGHWPARKRDEKMNYDLIALDMDGTVLTSKKVISPRTHEAIQTALDRGKEVIFATGRCPAEMREHFAAYPRMKYAMCLSGAMVQDLRTGEALASTTIPKVLALRVLELEEGLDAMVSVYAGDDVFVEHRRRGNMEYFGCQCFAELYDSCGVWVDDIRQPVEQYGDRIYKVNLYCHDSDTWNRAGELLKDVSLSYASGIPNNFEISPMGVDKGKGLQLVCAVAGIPLSRAIAVGDEGNDLAMIKAAGLGVAMGNAADEVLAAADAVTADCDHDGVAEVIKACLL